MKKVAFFGLLMSIALGSLMLTSCNKDSCGFALADLVISLNASQSSIQTGQTIDLFTAVSNVQQRCSADPAAAAADPSASDIQVEKYDQVNQRYVNVGGVAISDPNLNTGETNQSVTPITFNSPGLYRITSRTDVHSNVWEAKENNNKNVISIGREAPFVVTGEAIANTPTLVFGKTQSKVVSE